MDSIPLVVGTANTKHQHQRLLFMVLSIIGLLAITGIILLSSTDLSDAYGETSGFCGDNLGWTYNSTSKTVTITGSGAMWDFKDTDERWGGNPVRTIEIPAGVTYIGKGAFDGCSALQTISVDSGNTHYATTDGCLLDYSKHTFIRCPEGKTYSYGLPSGITTITSKAFANCSSLTGITLNSNVSTIAEDAFIGCKSLTRFINFGSNSNFSVDNDILFNSSKTKLICYPAAKSGTSYFIPESVLQIQDYAFFGTEKLNEIMVLGSNPNYSSIDGILCNKNGTKMIACPSGLKTVNVPSQITSIGRACFSGNVLEGLIFSGESNVVVDAYGIYNCRLLKTITIGDGKSVSFSDSAFYYPNRYAHTITITVSAGYLVSDGAINGNVDLKYNSGSTSDDSPDDQSGDNGGSDNNGLLPVAKFGVSLVLVLVAIGVMMLFLRRK